MDTNTPMPMKPHAASATRRGLERWRATACTSAPGRIEAFGRKLRCCGSIHHAATASEKLTAPLTSSAHRHDATSSTNAGTSLPISPPTVLPAM